MSRAAKVARLCLVDGVPKRSLFVALIVGTILNVINQGDVLLARGDVNVAKIVFTFLVPYCVATYGAVSYRLASARCDARGIERDDGAKNA